MPIKAREKTDGANFSTNYLALISLMLEAPALVRLSHVEDEQWPQLHCAFLASVKITFLVMKATAAATQRTIRRSWIFTASSILIN